MFSKKYFYHLRTSFIQVAVQVFIPLLLTPYMIGKLEEEMYGLWVLFITILGYFGLTGFGFGTTFLKETSKHNDVLYINRYLNSTLFLYLGLSFAAILVFLYLFINIDTVFLIPYGLMSEAKLSFVLFFLSFFISFISSLFGTLLFAKDRLYIQNYISIFSSIVSAFLMFIALYGGYKLISLAWIHLCMAIFSGTLVYFIAKKYVDFELSFKYFDPSLLKEMVKPSLHYFIITASALIVLSSDNIIISSFIGIGSVAFYAIGYKLVDISQKILFKIVDIMIPDIARLDQEKNYSAILKLHNKMLFLSMLLGFVGYGILFFYGIDFLNWWVGEKYVLDENIFRIFIAFGMVHAGVHVSAIFIVAMGLHRATSYMTIADAILNVVLSIILLRDYGLWGVAMGTLLAHILTSGWFTTWWFYKQIHIKFKENEGL
ncbi:MAG: Polysacc synt protein [Campylobacterota bacterium]|nr:Polysacc synt protein [Campylobacterota bacterium]